MIDQELSDRITQKKEIPIISSEWGYSSAWRGLSEQKQGELLPRTLLTNAANGISLSIWYDWRDDGPDANDPEHHFGTVFNSYHANREPVYDAKPAYLAVRTLSAFFNGYRFEKRVDVGSNSDYVLAFRKGDTLRFAAWTTGDSHTVVVPLGLKQLTAVRHTGESVELSSADQKAAAITLKRSPIYLR